MLLRFAARCRGPAAIISAMVVQFGLEMIPLMGRGRVDR